MHKQMYIAEKWNKKNVNKFELKTKEKENIEYGQKSGREAKTEHRIIRILLRKLQYLFTFDQSYVLKRFEP